ncbi:MAG: helix-turn-helix transcriptional regulator [bacterium]|nr:helix-turn-helix transcriptional regulator [bacterium]
MKTEQMIELGQRIKMVRKELHISQKHFARQINISGSFLSEVEAGKSKPGYEFFFNTSKVFKVHLPYLLHGVGEMFTDINFGPVTASKEPYGDGITNVEEMLWYIERVPTVKHTLLAYASKFIFENEALVKMELERSKEEMGENSENEPSLKVAK